MISLNNKPTNNSADSYSDDVRLVSIGCGLRMIFSTDSIQLSFVPSIYDDDDDDGGDDISFITTKMMVWRIFFVE